VSCGTVTQSVVGKLFSNITRLQAIGGNRICYAAGIDHMSAIVPHTSVAGESIGRRLRRERERRQIALASIAANSKISVSLFEDLERDDVSRWPSGIFRRSFIRAYAQAVGLDPELTTREFLERFPDPNDPAPAAAPPAQPKSALRLTLADTGRSFMRGRILASVRGRWAAIACDATVIGTIGLAMYVAMGTLWMPLCVALIGYYAGGILLLGNTPGVCLCASGQPTNDPPRRVTLWRRIRSYPASILPALRSKSRRPSSTVAECREWPSPQAF
jgi:transcriptional regulator with XRE-family HTH domain